MSLFSLRAKPFVVLGAKTSSTPSEIDTLAEWAGLDAVLTDADVQKARQVLLTPRLRLAAELAWLPGIDDAKAEALGRLVQTGDLQALFAEGQRLDGLARANILAHACAEGQASSTHVAQLALTWDSLDRRQLGSALLTARSRAGVGSASEEDVEKALSELRTSHARAAVSWFQQSGEPGSLMTAIVQDLLRHGGSGFLRVLVQAYDAAVEDALLAIEEELRHEIEAAERRPDAAQERARAIQRLLTKWDSLSQPAQLWSQSVGREEPRSLRVAGLVRSLAIDLTNEHDAILASEVLVEALLQTFPELESLSQTLVADREALISLKRDQAQAQLINGLAAACEAARREYARLAAAVAKPHSADRSGILRNLTEAFRRACDALEDRTPAFALVRDLALRSNNERDDPETAFRLLSTVLIPKLEVAPPKLAKQLREDQSVLFRNWLAMGLKKAGSSKRSVAALIKTLTSLAPPAEQAKLEKIARRLARSRIWGRVKATFWLGVCAVGGIAIMMENGPSSGRSTPQAGLTSPAPSWVEETSAVEVEPPPGRDRLLSSSEIRYCLFQGKRLDAMYSLATTNWTISQYNALIDHYTARCASFRYRPGTLEPIEQEARLRASELQAEAARTAASW